VYDHEGKSPRHGTRVSSLAEVPYFDADAPSQSTGLATCQQRFKMIRRNTHAEVRGVHLKRICVHRLWDNRISIHAAVYDHEGKSPRHGTRVSSLAEVVNRRNPPGLHP
jgi:hypothetical protein